MSFQAKDASSAFRTQIFITWQLDQAHGYLLESVIILPINLVKILEFFCLKKKTCLGEKIHKVLGFCEVVHESNIFKNQCLKWSTTLFIGTISQLEIPMQMDSSFIR